MLENELLGQYQAAQIKLQHRVYVKIQYVAGQREIPCVGCELNDDKTQASNPL